MPVSKSQSDWQKKNTVMIGLRIQNASGIPDALEYALIDSGKTKNAYIIDAIREKLQRDGYMTETAEDEVEE